MITILAYLTVYGLPILSVLAICYIWRKLFPPQPIDPPSPLKQLVAHTPEQQVALIIYVSYIRYAQNIFWYSKQWEWDFRKMAAYLTPKTQNRYVDTAFYKVLRECRAIDKVDRDKINDLIRQYPERYRNRQLQPPWVSVSLADVHRAVESVLTPHCVSEILRLQDKLDIPPPAHQTY